MAFGAGAGAAAASAFLAFMDFMAGLGGAGVAAAFWAFFMAGLGMVKKVRKQNNLQNLWSCNLEVEARIEKVCACVVCAMCGSQYNVHVSNQHPTQQQGNAGNKTKQ